MNIFYILMCNVFRFKEESVLKTLFFIFLAGFTFNLAADTEEFFKQLLNQGGTALISAQNKCRELPARNSALKKQMDGVYQKAYDNKNVATKVFAETSYLLGFLQERIDEACGKLMLADIDSIRLILMDEAVTLLNAKKKSEDFEIFIGNIFGTEYSKFLYLTVSVANLEKMHNDWATKMSSKRDSYVELVNNINDANKKLREEVTQYTKSYKLYFEEIAGPLDKIQDEKEKSAK
jgi:hypothetical protein